MTQICGIRDLFVVIVLMVFFLGPAIMRILGEKRDKPQGEGDGTDEQEMPVNRRPSPSATDPGKRDPDVTFRTTPPAAKVRRAVPRPRPVQIEQPIVERSLRPTMAKRAPSGKAAEPSISLTFDKDPLINGVVYSVVLGKPKGLDKPDYEFPA